MTWLADSLRAHPELAIFLTLAIGLGAARVRLGRFQLNTIIAVLLAGVLVGQAGIEISSATQWLCFSLFLFSIGFKTGPQFFRGLGRSAAPQVAVSVILCLAVIACAYGVARVFHLDAGTSAGLIAGGMNASATVGTAGDALARLPIEAAARQTLATHLTVAFAVTYLVGLLTEIAALVKVGPWLMRVDLVAECRQLESELGVAAEEFGIVSAYQSHVVRAYTVPSNLAGRTAADLELAFGGDRVFVERVRQAGRVAPAAPESRLAAGDVVAVSGPRSALGAPSNPLHALEVDDAELLDIPTVSVEVVVTDRDVVGRSFAEIGRTLGRAAAARGVFVRRIMRAGQALPLGPNVVVERGDVVTLVGARDRIELAAPVLGATQWPTPATDLVTVATAIVIGGLIGLPVIRLAGLDVGLSLPVGVLAGGLVAGYLRSIRPVFGYIPEPALALFDSFGLSAFIAIVGIGAGPGFVNGLRESGALLAGVTVIVCLVPNVIAILVGRYVFRMHPGVLLGVCAGAGTSPAGLAAVQDAAKSRVPTLGYGVSYAVGNVLLALWGSVIVTLLR